MSLSMPKSIRIGSNGDAPLRNVTLNGTPVVWKQRIKHLGNIITSDLSDQSDIEYKKGVFVSQVNKMNNKLSAVSSNVKGQLLQTYCCSWYGCQTWDLTSRWAHSMTTEWNKAVRRTLRIPYTTCTKLLPLIVKGRTFKQQHITRVSKFIQSFLVSGNSHVLLIGERARRTATGALGRNWVRCAAAAVPAPCADLLARAQGIRELLDVRDGITFLPGFTKDDTVLVITDLCCH